MDLKGHFYDKRAINTGTVAESFCRVNWLSTISYLEVDQRN